MRYPGIRTEIPIFRISPGGVYMYSMWDPPYIPDHSDNARRSRSSQLDATSATPTLPHPKNYPGRMTPTSRRSLIRAINLLVAIALPKKAVHFQSGREFTFRVNFITLTLPASQGAVTDKELKRGPLKNWLRYWSREARGMSYVWRAERQANGNLHIHITTDRYILYSDIRDTWNNRLDALGFIDSFEAKHHHRHPNSTDVHAVAHVRNLANYIAKYMSKQDREPDGIEGRVWDCSANLKADIRCEYAVDHDIAQLFQRLQEQYPHRTWSTEWAGGIRLSEEEMKHALPDSFMRDYEAYLQQVRSMAELNTGKSK